MGSWIHCNSCHILFGRSSQHFYLTRCGHFACPSCNAKQGDKCSVCNAPNITAVDICSPELPSQVRPLFYPDDKVQEQLGKCSENFRKLCGALNELVGQTFESIKIIDFQRNQSFRLNGYLAQKIEHMEQNSRNTNAKIFELEKKLKSLQEEIDNNNRGKPAFLFDNFSSNLRSSGCEENGRSNVQPFANTEHPSKSYSSSAALEHRSVPTPESMRHTVTFLQSPSLIRSSSALEAIKDISSAMQACRKYSTASNSASSPKVNSTPARNLESRVSLKPSSYAAASPISQASGRIAVSAFKGKSRNECLQMTPGTFSDSGSLDSPVQTHGNGFSSRRSGTAVSGPSLVPSFHRASEPAGIQSQDKPPSTPRFSFPSNFSTSRFSAHTSQRR